LRVAAWAWLDRAADQVVGADACVAVRAPLPRRRAVMAEADSAADRPVGVLDHRFHAAFLVK
jgi:hypothetical protein